MSVRGVSDVGRASLCEYWTCEVLLLPLMCLAYPLAGRLGLRGPTIRVRLAFGAGRITLWDLDTCETGTFPARDDSTKLSMAFARARTRRT